MKTPTDLFSIVLAAGVAINTVMCMGNIVAENHSMTVINFLSGICLLFAYENRRNRNDK